MKETHRAIKKMERRLCKQDAEKERKMKNSTDVAVLLDPDTGHELFDVPGAAFRHLDHRLQRLVANAGLVSSRIRDLTLSNDQVCEQGK